MDKNLQSAVRVALAARNAQRKALADARRVLDAAVVSILRLGAETDRAALIADELGERDYATQALEALTDGAAWSLGDEDAIRDAILSGHEPLEQHFDTSPSVASMLQAVEDLQEDEDE